MPGNDIIDCPYIVKNISYYSKNLSSYDLRTGTNYITYRDNIIVVDTTGKFATGDTIYVCLKKK